MDGVDLIVNPYEPPGMQTVREGQPIRQSPPGSYLLNALGLIVGVELFGMPLLVLYAFYMPRPTAESLRWLPFAVLVAASVLGSVAFPWFARKLYRISKRFLEDSQRVGTDTPHSAQHSAKGQRLRH